MLLSKVASFFDNQSFKDSYTGDHVLYGQMDLFNGTVRDGITSVRAIISMAPDLAIPARKALTLGSNVWLMSDRPNTDFFKAKPIRDNYVAHQADGLAEIKTILQELSNTAGTMAYGSMIWQKGEKEVAESSTISNISDIYFANSEVIPNLSIVKLRGITYLARYSYLTTGGFLVAVSDQLDAPNFETISYTSNTYNPITDARTGAPTSIKALRIRWQDKFEYMTRSSAKYLVGDDVVLVRKVDASSVSTGDVVVLSDGPRRVESYQDDGLLWHLHVRRM